MENYKDNIIATRVGSLGSSDAKMVAKIGRVGKLAYADKERLAVLTGQKEQHDFSNAATRNGDYIEQEIFKDLQNKWDDAKSNPIWLSPSLSTNRCDVINHIDIETVQGEYLVWYEVKASRYSTAQVKAEYEDQLKWHHYLLNEKASLMHLKPALLLVHYLVEDYNAPYDPERVTTIPVHFNGDYFADIQKGLDIINEALADFKWEPREELEASDLPDNLRQQLDYITARLREAEQIKAETESFKEKLLAVCLQNGVKSIKAEGWSAIIKEGYVSSRLNSSKLKADHPDLYEQYLSQSNVKPSLTLKVN